MDGEGGSHGRCYSSDLIKAGRKYFDMSIVIDSVVSGGDDPDEKEQICGNGGNAVCHDVLSKLEKFHDDA